MDAEQEVRESFPELNEISDEEMREKVVESWVHALEAGNYDSLSEMGWWPSSEAGIGGKAQISHVRDVTQFAISMTDQIIERNGVDIDRDLVVAGALLHDISKPFEFSPEGDTELVKYLPHPHYAVHLLKRVGFSLHMQHLVLAHSHRSGVEPRTLEAKIVQLADWMASHVIFWQGKGVLYHNIP